MPRQETSRFKLSHGWLRGEDWWGDPVSLNFVLNDMLLHPCVKSMTELQPPQANTIGDMYVVPLGGTGSFAGHEGALAVLTPEGWVFCTPTRGVRLRCDNPDAWYWWNGTDWVTEDWVPDGPAKIGTRYDINISVGFEALPGDYLCSVYLPEAMTLPAGAPDSGGRSADWPPGTIVMSIRRNGSEVGTIAFAPDSVTAVVTVEADRLFGAGDLVSVVMPDALPDGFENYGITLRFLLNN